MPAQFETRRLVLRPYTHDDAPALLQAVQTSRESLLPWLPWARSENRTLAECHYTIEKFLRDMAAPDCQAYAFAAFDKADGSLVGGSGFHHVIPATHQAEVGYWTRAERRRQGYCAEFTAGMISWLLTPCDSGGWGFRRIEIQCASRNLASQAVPRKLGLRQEARILQHRWLDGYGWDDTLMWGVLRDEWDAATHQRRADAAGTASSAG